MNLRRGLFVLYLSVIVAVGLTPIQAQDATPPVVPPVQVMDAPEVTPVVVSPEDGGTVVVNPPSSSGWQLAIIVVAAGLIGSLAAGIPLTVVMLSMSKEHKDQLEGAFKSLPPETQATIRAGVMTAAQVESLLQRVLDNFKAVIGVAVEVTDGEPNEPEPPDGTAAASPPGGSQPHR